jgi:chemotaxis protein CheD
MIAVGSSAQPEAPESTQAVGIGQCIVSNDIRLTLVSYGLGSCVGIAMFDATVKVAGLLHILLPEPSGRENGASPMRFASTGIPALIREMESQGAQRTRIRAVAAGGAQMLSVLAKSGPLKGIGERNVAVVCHTLEAEKIKLAASDFGGTSGRTIGIVVATGATWVREAGKPSCDL